MFHAYPWNTDKMKRRRKRKRKKKEIPIAGQEDICELLQQPEVLQLALSVYIQKIDRVSKTSLSTMTTLVI